MYVSRLAFAACVVALTLSAARAQDWSQVPLAAHSALNVAGRWTRAS
jgi:hypothetical protein